MITLQALHRFLDGCGGLQELFLQEFAARAHAVMVKDEQRKGNMLDYKDLGVCGTIALCSMGGRRHNVAAVKE